MKVWLVLFNANARSIEAGDELLSVPGAELCRCTLVRKTKKGWCLEWGARTKTFPPETCFGEREQAETYARTLYKQAIEREKERHAAWLAEAEKMEIDSDDLPAECQDDHA